MSRLDGLLRLESGIGLALAELSEAQADTVKSLGSCFLTGVVYAASSFLSSALQLIIKAREAEQRDVERRAALEGENE